MGKTVVGLYRDLTTAQDVVRELEDNGFRPQDLSIITRDPRGKPRMETASDRGENVTEGAVGGAGIGAVLGGVAGLVVGLGSLAIPGIGPIIAAGPLATTLAGAGVGAVAGGIVGALVSMGVPEDDAKAYVEGVRQGHMLVAVSTPDEHAQHAADIMNRHNPIDVHREAENWRAEHGTMDEETDRLPASQTGSRMGEDYGRPADEHVNVEHRPADRPATDADLWAFEEGSFEAPVTREAQEREGTVRDTVRRTGVRTEDMGDYPSFDRFEPQFRRDYQTRYANTGYDYNTYRSAYLQGYTLHRESDCDGHCRWEDLEPEARADWERAHPESAWEQFKDAVHEGWNALTTH